MTLNPVDPLCARDGAVDVPRLERERERADAAYNDALTALDGAIQRLREMPRPPRPYDETQVTPLNERWEILSLKPVESGGWLRRVRASVWAMVAPLFERQQAFNSALVDHVNRNVAMHRETTLAIENTLAVCREELERLVAFESKLILYAQEITAYVDTKDRCVAGLSQALAGALSGLSDELQKRWESTVAREQRYEAQANELRGSLNVVQRAVHAFKSELEQRRTPEAAPAAAAVPPTVPAPARVESPLDSYKYVGFEDQFRGSQQEVRERMAAYVPDFEDARDILDIGCGRGEFLDLLRERAIPARGVDINDEMAAACRDRGLEVTSGDALSYLLAQPDASLGGLFSAQVVEHLEAPYLIRLLDAAYLKLRPGATIVLETINPACWWAFFENYLRDFTHVRPVHPETLRYLLIASGFQRVEIRYAVPFPEESKLQAFLESAPGKVAPSEPLSEMAAVYDENARKLNALLFTYLDYAVVAERP